MKIYGVCPEFRDQLFSVVMGVISRIPPPTRKRRRLQQSFVFHMCIYLLMHIVCMNIACNTDAYS